MSLNDLERISNVQSETDQPRLRGFSTPHQQQHQLPEEARLLINNALRKNEQLQNFGEQVLKWATEYRQRCLKYGEALQASAKEQASAIERLHSANEGSFRVLQEGHDRFMREIAGNQSR